MKEKVNASDAAARLRFHTQTGGATLTARTQQLLAHETGVPDVADPLGGSWYLESLTAKLETADKTLVEEVEVGGGSVKAIERGFFQEAIARSAYVQQREVEAGGQVVVGVNEYVTGEPVPAIAAPDYSTLAAQQRRRLAELRGKRDTGTVKRTLAALEGAAREASAPLMEPILDAVRARATLGEISDVFRSAWGLYDPR